MPVALHHIVSVFLLLCHESYVDFDSSLLLAVSYKGVRLQPLCPSRVFATGWLTLSTVYVCLATRGYVSLVRYHDSNILLCLVDPLLVVMRSMGMRMQPLVSVARVCDVLAHDEYIHYASPHVVRSSLDVS